MCLHVLCICSVTDVKIEELTKVRGIRWTEEGFQLLGAGGVARGGAGSLAGAGRDSEPPHCEPDLAKMSVLSRIVLKDTHFQGFRSILIPP